MEACLAVEREQDKVLKRLKTLSGSSADKLQKLIDEVSLLQQQISEGKHSYLKPTTTTIMTIVMNSQPLPSRF